MVHVGDKVPEATVFVLRDGGPQAVSTSELFGGKRVVVFGVPGAFTRTCSAQHLPGFVAKADAFKAKGVDAIYCLAVNDVFVLSAWGEAHGAAGKIAMVSDGSLNFTRAAGLEADMSERGFGVRCRRFAMVIGGGVVEKLYLEEAGAFGETSADNVLDDL